MLKHHFLFFRHCVRSTSGYVDPGNDSLSEKLNDYMGTSTPDWQAGEMECLPNSLDMVQNTGEWLIDSGVISPKAKIKWEIISDDVHRDVDTAYFLADGIYDALKRNYGDSLESQGERDIHVDYRFSDPAFCMPNLSNDAVADETKRRIESLPPPTISFRQGLQLMEQLVGVGKFGELSGLLPIDPVLDVDDWTIPGAPSILRAFGETAFFAKAGDVKSNFPAKATPEQIYQLLQFQHWYRSATEVGHSYNAVYGAIQVHALLRILRYGYYQTDMRPVRGSEDYDTAVTIVLGHDGDLNCIATALGASWILKEPYISGPGGAFLPTPPMSGIHAVRDVQSDQIDLSFVYPVYSTTASDGKNKYFRRNTTGILEYTPLRLKETLRYSQVNSKSTRIIPPTDKSVDSVQVLEDYLLDILSGYNQRATDCFHAADDYWGSPSPPEAFVSITNEATLSESSPKDETTSTWRSAPAFLLFAVAGCTSIVVIWMSILRFRKTVKGHHEKLDNQLWEGVRTANASKHFQKRESTVDLTEEEENESTEKCPSSPIV